jgi:hypothetical protein
MSQDEKNFLIASIQGKYARWQKRPRGDDDREDFARFLSRQRPMVARLLEMASEEPKATWKSEPTACENHVCSESVRLVPLLSLQEASARLRRLFSPSLPNSLQNGSGGAEVLIRSYDLSLRCPLSTRQIQLPARSRNCLHVEAFDLHNFVHSCILRGQRHLASAQPVVRAEQSCGGLHSLVGIWKCPLCGVSALPAELQRDGFILLLLRFVPNASTLSVRITSEASNLLWDFIPPVAASVAGLSETVCSVRESL